MIHTNDIIIAYCKVSTLRHISTSGGIGSCTILKLFKKGYINSALSYKFDRNDLEYHPYIIEKANDYIPTGSIYHEIKLIDFIKNNIDKIKSPFACFALPCQVSPIKNILDKHGIESFIIELTCSSQQSHEATEYLIKRAGIKKEDILHIKYRGNGWPSGITISLKNKNNIFYDNNNSLWSKIFHSHIFIMRRCFFCSAVKKTYSDIQLADPWGIDKPNKEHEGRTLCYVKSKKASEILNILSEQGDIEYEKTGVRAYYNSQMGTIVRKNFNNINPNITRLTRNIIQNKNYKNTILQYNFLFSLHCLTYKFLFKILHKIGKAFDSKNLKNYKQI